MTECKFCKSAHVTEHEENDVISYQGSQLSIPLVFSTCEQCEREFISKQQIMVNEARIRDAKKSHDGLMTSHEIFEARTRLGITQEQASLVFGGGKNAFSKYERAEVSQSAAMDTLIRVCLKHPSVFQDLLLIKKIKQNVSQLKYEDNIIAYPKFFAANQDKYTSKKTITMKEVAYG